MKLSRGDVGHWLWLLVGNLYIVWEQSRMKGRVFLSSCVVQVSCPVSFHLWGRIHAHLTNHNTYVTICSQRPSKRQYTATPLPGPSHSGMDQCSLCICGALIVTRILGVICFLFFLQNHLGPERPILAENELDGGPPPPQVKIWVKAGTTTRTS